MFFWIPYGLHLWVFLRKGGHCFLTVLQVYILYWVEAFICEFYLNLLYTCVYKMRQSLHSKHMTLNSNFVQKKLTLTLSEGQASALLTSLPPQPIGEQQTEWWNYILVHTAPLSYRPHPGCQLQMIARRNLGGGCSCIDSRTRCPCNTRRYNCSLCNSVKQQNKLYYFFFNLVITSWTNEHSCLNYRTHYVLRVGRIVTFCSI